VQGEAVQFLRTSNTSDLRVQLCVIYVSIAYVCVLDALFIDASSSSMLNCMLECVLSAAALGFPKREMFDPFGVCVP